VLLDERTLAHDGEAVARRLALAAGALLL